MKENKTYVRIIKDEPGEPAKSGDIGYIDGYVRGGNDVPYAVVVIQKTISLVSIYNLVAIS